jgi:hypothetical protein
MVILVLLSGIAAIAVLVAAYAAGRAIYGHGHLRGEHFAILAVIFAYPLTFVSVFFNTAIAAAASAALDGRRLGLGQALAVPLRRIAHVALWSLAASILGVVVEQLASRIPAVGAILARVLGLGWALASLFAIPILAIDGCSAPQCLRRSTQIVKKRWGEGISGNAIITAWTFLAFLALVVLFVPGVAATGRHSAARDAVLVAGIVAFVVLVGLGALIRQVFAVVLYRYATSGAPPAHFNESDLNSPFGERSGLFRR